MKFSVECYVIGKTFCVQCYANNPSDAKRVVQNQYPNAKIVSVNAVLW